jgi:hypothetical protein
MASPPVAITKTSATLLWMQADELHQFADHKKQNLIQADGISAREL